MATLTRLREPVEEEKTQPDVLLSSQVPAPFPVDLLRDLQGPAETPAPEAVDAVVDPFADQESDLELRDEIHSPRQLRGSSGAGELKEGLKVSSRWVQAVGR